MRCFLAPKNQQDIAMSSPLSVLCLLFLIPAEKVADDGLDPGALQAMKKKEDEKKKKESP